jgi:enamine deaminase RidA (YjgF/YER057c/UK114 family)
MSSVQTVNPWTWQDKFGYSQAFLVTGAQRVLFCSGQTSVDANGAPLHAGDMGAQLDQALGNLETVLQAGGLSLANVVRLNFYVTDLPAFLKASQRVADKLPNKPPGTLLGVSALFHPDILVEIEATAAA